MPPLHSDPQTERSLLGWRREDKLIDRSLFFQGKEPLEATRTGEERETRS